MFRICGVVFRMSHLKYRLGSEPEEHFVNVRKES